MITLDASIVFEIIRSHTGLTILGVEELLTVGDCLRNIMASVVRFVQVMSLFALVTLVHEFFVFLAVLDFGDGLAFIQIISDVQLVEHA